MKRITLPSLLSIFALALGTTGCDISTTGAAGKIEFTPDECGLFAGCDFANPIGTGGAVLTRIAGIDGFGTAGIQLESSDPAVLSIVPVGDVGQPTWQLFGVSEGTARVEALDVDGSIADYIEVSVTRPTELTLESVIGEAEGPMLDAPGYDQHWIVDANQRALFYTHATLEDGTPVMGQYTYEVTVDAALVDTVEQPEILPLGRLDVTPVTPGEYDLQFDSDLGPSLFVLLEVREAL